MIASVFQPERRTYSCQPFADHLTSALAPDIVLVLDDDKTTKFFAHRFVLAYHSGYFHTLFATYSGTEVHLSNIDPSTCSVLLGFMYTGQLHVNAQNVHDLLTASNLLYILSVSELCEEYLRQCQRLEHTRTALVIKPVPRKNPVTLSTVAPVQPSDTLKYQPLRTNEDDSSSIFKPIAKISSSSSSSSEKLNSNVVNPETVVATTTKTSCSNTIVYDIACCDGPIKFRKVVNQFYVPGKTNDIRGSSQAAIVACHDGRIVAKNDHSQPQRKNAICASFQFQKSDDNDDDTSTNSETKLSNHGRGQAESVEDLCVLRSVIKNDVQYYPCKNCGSKFPSYYFVNKHRKLCHKNVSDPSTTKD